MKTIRTGITRLTTGQCSRIAGGDPGMVLAAGGNGGGFSGGDMAMASAGIGYAGGPMVTVTIGLPGNAPLSGFDNFLIGMAGTAVGGFTMAAVGLGLASTGVGTGIAIPVAGLAGGAAGALAIDGTTKLLQYAANEQRYGGRVRRAVP
ncbi:hypothetical protein [Massilia eurypsychrophila]|jgi:hypothetical protein|nr:hypothetical protein [Massilia eurypsychrophila]